MSETSTGLKKETAAALSYLLGPITGVIVLVLEKDEYIRFQAMQSIVVFISLFVLHWVLGITVILAFLLPLVSLVSFVLWLVLIYKALQGEKFQVPFLGKYVTKLL